MFSESPDWCLIDQEAFINSQYKQVTCKPGQFSLLAPHIATTNTTLKNTHLPTNENKNTTITTSHPPNLPDNDLPNSDTLSSTILPNGASILNNDNDKPSNDLRNTTNTFDNNAQAQNQITLPNNSQTTNTETKSKKRKRKKDKNNNPKSFAIDEEYLPVITKDYNFFLQSQLFSAHFPHPTLHETPSNAERLQDINLLEWGETMKAMQHFSNAGHDILTIHESKQEIEANNLFNTFVAYHGSNENEIVTLGTSFVLPPLCSFLMSDITNIRPLVDNKPSEGFHLIVIDPPWENKSAHRSNKYHTLPNFDLFKLPVQPLSHQNGIVAVWVTNKSKFIKFVKDSLFPYWGFSYLVTWHWLKVTNSGELPFPLDSQHKKPYESIIIGTRNLAVIPNVSSISNHKTIVSIPGAHSRKPCIQDLFKGVIVSDPNCLELFARNLVGGWTSWGNEVLKFQNEMYFTRKE